MTGPRISEENRRGDEYVSGRQAHMPPNRYRGRPMTLANTRENGVRMFASSVKRTLSDWS